MAYGTVNVPGVSGPELEEVRKLAQEAKKTADAAQEAITQITSAINAVPVQKGSLTYTGGAQQPEWDNYDPKSLTIGGTQSATDAGEYEATFTPKEGYKWYDGTTEAKTVIWKIGRASIATPEQKGSLTYTGSAQQPEWKNYDSQKMTLKGETTGTNAGNYTAKFTPTENYQWSDGKITERAVIWQIGRATVEMPRQSGKLVYTGQAQSPVWEQYDSEKLSLSGETTGTNAGNYTAEFTPTENYQWPDSTAVGKEVVWKIERATVELPVQEGTLTYTGSELHPSWSGYDPEKFNLSGTVSGINAGQYTARFTPKENYQWDNGGVETREVEWRIERAEMEVPQQQGVLIYNGRVQSPVWNGYDSEKMTMSGTTSSINVGSYTVKFTPKNNYQWSDHTIDGKEVTWKISLASLSVPTQTGVLTYNGYSQSPSWSGYDPEKMILGGTVSGTNAGSYSAKFTPRGNYQWEDGTSVEKTVIWTIGKAEGSLQLSTSNVELNIGALTKEVTVTRSGDGVITATSNRLDVATVEVNSTTLVIRGISQGTANITVHVLEGTNHKATSSKTILVTVKMLPENLEEATPGDIQMAAQSGQAKNLWSVGDKTPIAVNGMVGEASLNGTYYAIILGFDHNSSVEGSNSIHFQIGKNASGTDIAFVDHYPEPYYAFYMCHGLNEGGWIDSYMRKTICPAFFAVLPKDWQNIIVACTKYSDNTGGGDNTASYVTSTQDKIWLLSEFEVQGKRTYANSAEQNYQKQYDYYKNGNSKMRYKHNDPSTACSWWLRSVFVTQSKFFCNVSANGDANFDYAYWSLGLAPGFKVA